MTNKVNDRYVAMTEKFNKMAEEWRKIAFLRSSNLAKNGDRITLAIIEQFDTRVNQWAQEYAQYMLEKHPEFFEEYSKPGMEHQPST